MASAVGTDKILSNLLVQIWDHDPGTTDAKVTSPDGGTTERWVDLRDYDKFAAAVCATVFGGTGPVLLEIVASEAEDETDGSVTVIKTSGAIVLNALTEWHVLECSAEEIVQLGEAAGYDLRYVAARITTQHLGDEAVVVYLATPRRPHDAVTANSNTL